MKVRFDVLDPFALLGVWGMSGKKSCLQVFPLFGGSIKGTREGSAEATTEATTEGSGEETAEATTEGTTEGTRDRGSDQRNEKGGDRRIAVVDGQPKRAVNISSHSSYKHRCYSSVFTAQCAVLSTQ